MLLSRKILIISLVVVVLMVTGVLITIPALIMGDMVNGHVDCTEIYRADDDGLSADKIKLTTSDHYDIIAYEAEEPLAVFSRTYSNYFYQQHIHGIITMV